MPYPSMIDAKMHQNAQICMLKFNIFSGLNPQTPKLGRGYGILTQPPFPSALRASLWVSGLSIASDSST